MFLGALDIDLLDTLPRVVAEVQALHDAIADGDVQTAERLWREKFERWIRDLVGRLEEDFDDELWAALTRGAGAGAPPPRSPRDRRRGAHERTQLARREHQQPQGRRRGHVGRPRVAVARAPVERGELAEEVARRERRGRARRRCRRSRRRRRSRRSRARADGAGRPPRRARPRSSRAWPESRSACVSVSSANSGRSRIAHGGNGPSACTSDIDSARLCRGRAGAGTSARANQSSTHSTSSRARRVVEHAEPDRVLAVQPRRGHERLARRLQLGHRARRCARLVDRERGGSTRSRAAPGDSSSSSGVSRMRRSREQGEVERAVDRGAEGVEPERLDRQPDLQRPPAARELQAEVGEVDLALGDLGVLEVVGDDLERPPQLRALADEQRAALDRLVEPLVRVERDRVGELDPAQRRRARARSAPRSRRRPHRRAATRRARGRRRPARPAGRSRRCWSRPRRPTRTAARGPRRRRRDRLGERARRRSRRSAPAGSTRTWSGRKPSSRAARASDECAWSET